jgi:prepilin-type N-terminal cleavage/methylation domain-containing protein
MVARQARPGFTLIELLVVVAVLIIAGGLLLAGLRVARVDARRTECANNLKQLILAFHNCNDTYSRLPPAIGTFPPNAAPVPPNFGNAFFFTLPFYEANVLYKQSAGVAAAAGGAVAGKSNAAHEAVNWPGFNNVFSKPVKTLQCPNDPSMTPDGVYADETLAAYIGSTSLDASGKEGYFTQWGLSSYALNAQVFLTVDQNVADGGPGGRPAGKFGDEGRTPGGKYKENGGTKDKPLGFGYFDPQGDLLKGLDAGATLARSFPDGLSNTILITERYARCTSANPALKQPFNIGGNYWAYDGVDELGGKAPAMTFGSNEGINKPTKSSGWLPASHTAKKPHQATPVFPMFAWNLWDGPGTPYYKAGNMISIGPESKPLFNPMPFSGKDSQCDPRVASAAHNVLPAGMADGSVHNVAAGISGATWWAAVTPNDGGILGTDW